MAKNRKNLSASVRFGPALKAVCLCLFIGGAGVGYVQQKNQLHILGEQKRQREVRLDKLRRENEARLRWMDTLQAPAELEVRIKQMNLGLVAPQPDQIVRLAENAGAASAKGAHSLYAEQVVQVSDRH